MSDKKIDKLPSGETSLLDIANLLGCTWSSMVEVRPDLFPDGTLHYEFIKDGGYAKKGDKRSFHIENVSTTIYKTDKKTNHFAPTTRIKLIPRYSIKALYEI